MVCRRFLVTLGLIFGWLFISAAQLGAQPNPTRDGIKALHPPTNLRVSVDDNPFKGDGAAKLTLIEFSGYQRPSCARHFRQTLPQIETQYISTTKLKYALRDFPNEKRIVIPAPALEGI